MEHAGLSPLPLPLSGSLVLMPVPSTRLAAIWFGEYVCCQTIRVRLCSLLMALKQVVSSAYDKEDEYPRSVRMRVPFPVVYFSMRTLPQKRVKGHLAGGPSIRWRPSAVVKTPCGHFSDFTSLSTLVIWPEADRPSESNELAWRNSESKQPLHDMCTRCRIALTR